MYFTRNDLMNGKSKRSAKGVHHLNIYQAPEMAVHGRMLRSFHSIKQITPWGTQLFLPMASDCSLLVTCQVVKVVPTSTIVSGLTTNGANR